MADYISTQDIQALRYKPTDVNVLNGNDVRALIFDVFAHFSHLAPAEWFLKRFDSNDMHLDFGLIQIRDHQGFRDWYEDWLVHCPWEYHIIEGIEVSGSASSGFTAQFLLHHTGEWKHGPGKINEAMTVGIFNRLLRETWRLKVHHNQFFITYYGAEFLLS